MITPRDHDVLMELIKGKRNKEIGKALNMCDMNVKHRLMKCATVLGLTEGGQLNRVKLAVEAYYQMNPEKRI